MAFSGGKRRIVRFFVKTVKVAGFVYDFRTVTLVFVTMKFLTLFLALCTTVALSKDPDKVNVWSMQRAPVGATPQVRTYLRKAL